MFIFMLLQILPVMLSMHTSNTFKLWPALDEWNEDLYTWLERSVKVFPITTFKSFQSLYFNILNISTGCIYVIFCYADARLHFSSQFVTRVNSAQMSLSQWVFKKNIYSTKYIILQLDYGNGMSATERNRFHSVYKSQVLFTPLRHAGLITIKTIVQRWRLWLLNQPQEQ